MSWSPASGRAEIEARLRNLGGQSDAEIDLAGAALLLAALDRPRVALNRYSHHLSLLEREACQLGAELGAGGRLSARVEALTQVIVGRHGYSGDRQTYDDLQNANLIRVIDRRKGLPVSLGILYIHVARAQGWVIDGLNFPGHFLVRLELGSERAILDPFDDGRVCETAALREILKSVMGPQAELHPEHYAPVGNRRILFRLQNNLKRRLLQSGSVREALEVIEGMLMFAPQEAELWREAGLLHERLGNLRAAMMSLQQFMELGENARSLYEVAARLEALRTRLN